MQWSVILKVNINQEIVKELRTRKLWTQEKLAEMSRVHTRTIQRIENEGVASTQTLNAIASVFDVDARILQTTADNSISSDQVYVPGKHSRLDFMERNTVKKFVKNARKMEDWTHYRWVTHYQWVSWIILLIGGYVTVNAILITEANLSSLTIFNVLLPGVAIGLVLMLLGGFGIHIAEKAREQKRLARLVTKLMTR
jgi:transcriptional regulator with XRE-family HTH domain